MVVEYVLRLFEYLFLYELKILHCRFVVNLIIKQNLHRYTEIDIKTYTYTFLMNKHLVGCFSVFRPEYREIEFAK